MVRHVGPLARRKSFRRPKVAFYVFCEGSRTEPDYFNALARISPYSLVDIKTVAGAGVPKTIAQRAVDEAAIRGIGAKNRRRKNSFEVNDEVWVVFDRDEHPDFAAAVAQCENAGIGVARSDPCFEVWLILHFEDYNRPDHRHKTQDHFGELCPLYDRKSNKTTDCSAIVGDVEKAEARAEAQLAARAAEGAAYSAPSTTVFMLTRRLRSPGG